ncbi:hypothetical protein Mgra_00008795 [Meloidogyne graminicola]|uniref:MARVEL domain-containing protein n=1 Tax=Meloidogyne graminicola TaxID=189291 RepID=A0A8S9ZEV9_9BILA|nr:hypothetical protein Mgra_00008795 [Meloidogyne graminicola]
MGVNVQRFVSLPNALKPLILLLTLLSILLAASAPMKETPSGMWFFWLTSILQLIFITSVNILFVYESESFLSCGRESGWPVVEMSYSGVCTFCGLINVFILAGAHKHETNAANSCLVAAFTTLFMTILYAIGGLMMFRIWRGFVKSGGNQNPTPNIQTGNIGSMHPGV